MSSSQNILNELANKIGYMNIYELQESYKKVCNWNHPNKEKVIELLNEYIRDKYGVTWEAYCDLTFNIDNFLK